MFIETLALGGAALSVEWFALIVSSLIGMSLGFGALFTKLFSKPKAVSLDDVIIYLFEASDHALSEVHSVSGLLSFLRGLDTLTDDDEEYLSVRI